MPTPEVREAVRAWLSDLDSPIDHAALAKRFWALTRIDEWWQEVQVGDENACLRWNGSLNVKGYPIFTIKGMPLYAHRVAVRIGLDDIAQPRAVPSDMTVDHVRERGCTFRDCVLPMHLEVVTLSANVKRVRDMSVFT